MKKVIILVFSFALALILTACSESEYLPYDEQDESPEIATTTAIEIPERTETPTVTEEPPSATVTELVPDIPQATVAQQTAALRTTTAPQVTTAPLAIRVPATTTTTLAIAVCAAPEFIFSKEREAIINEVVSRIDNIRTAGGGANAIHNKTSDIERFYLPPLKIDGFEFSSAHVDSRRFTFYYGLENVDYWRPGIEVSITRIDVLNQNGGSVSFFNSSINQLRSQGHDYKVEDNLLLVTRFNKVTGFVGDLYFTIRVPDHLNNYDFLCDLALQVINSAKLVDVQHELDVMRQARD